MCAHEKGNTEGRPRLSEHTCLYVCTRACLKTKARPRLGVRRLQLMICVCVSDCHQYVLAGWSPPRPHPFSVWLIRIEPSDMRLKARLKHPRVIIKPGKGGRVGPGGKRCDFVRTDAQKNVCLGVKLIKNQPL